MKKILITLLSIIGFSFVGCTSLSKVNPNDFEANIDSKKVKLYTLKNKNGMEMTVTNFGARVVELFVADKNGKFDDVVLGHRTLDGYQNCKIDRFLGATIGRVGNRIANGTFTFNGKKYTIPQNDNKNALHGGKNGFDMKVWDVVSVSNNEIHFRLVSQDGDEGFPAKLTVDMVYRLTNDNAFEIEYKATSDNDTVVNLTHHSFFNLHGEGNGTINDHIMTMNAQKFTPVDETLIPTGEVRDVKGTPFDFTKPTVIGKRLDAKDEQLKFARGYDHNWVLNKPTKEGLNFAVEVFDPVSGRNLRVYTTEPAIQFYGGNFLTGEIGKNGKPYVFRGSFVIETQHYPDSPNQPNFPSIVLKKGKQYHHICRYEFSVK